MSSPVNLYDLAYMLALPPAAALVGYKMLRHNKYRESGPALIGIGLGNEDPKPWRGGSIWVHAVSVGEVIAARAMLPHLRKRFPNLPILLTTHTETGQAAARSIPADLVDAVRYFPLDFSWLIRRYVKIFQPRIFILMETELWPNALNIIGGSGAQIFTLNGKISENSFRNYQKFHRVIKRPLQQITAFCTQTDQDARRIAALINRSDNVHVTGNCKFDVEIPALTPDQKDVFARELSIPWPARYIVAGSTHPGEEEIMISALRDVLTVHPDSRMLLIPRHPERFEDVWNLVCKSGIPAMRLSDRATTSSESPRILLVDVMGILSKLYGLGEVAIVAGSFTSGIGGHNILEPAAHGVPVIYGPDMKGQPDMARILSPANGGTIATPNNLAEKITELLAHPDTARQKGETGRRMYQANRGSALRNMDVINMYCLSKRP